ncbi:hypothetical protein F4803DRAFT_192940 [Xylaria telfairii]|nr:hypothetical protein F4803DRAFT_192940 [Xylaria telfairii]
MPAPTLPPLYDGDLEPTRTGFNPTVNDVVEVRRMFTDEGIGDRRVRVPMEIALMILPLAEYHPRQTSVTQAEAIYRADEFWRPGPHASIIGLYLTVATLPVPDTVARAKSITFQMKAADQGWATWGGDGTYDNSHTWYEASILRPRSAASTVAALTDACIPNFPDVGEARDHLQNQNQNHGWDMVESNGTVVWKVHNNITASGQYRYYRVDWVAGIPTEVDASGAMGDGQGFLGLLRPDDVVVLWARAEQQAWINKIQGATMEIAYEVL